MLNLIHGAIMNAIHRPILSSLTPRLLITFAGLLAIATPGLAQRTRQAPEFFRAVAPDEAGGTSDQPAALRQRNVQLNLDVLPKPGQTREGGEPTRLAFTIFPDVALTGTLERLEAAHDDGFVAAFGLDQDPEGHAYISVVGEASTATFRFHGRLFQMHHVGNGKHSISEVDEKRVPSCGTIDAGSNRDEMGPGGGSSESITTDQVLDIMVLYTDDARASNGGEGGINSLINLAVFESNQGYAQSDVVMRLNLVHTLEVSFSETGSMESWVIQLRNTTDGVLDGIHCIRDSYGADAVCMITDTAGTDDLCGIAYKVWTSFLSNQAVNAFTVTMDSCATGRYVFAHELGHTLGLQHDRANTYGSALYPWCYGYRTGSGLYRSIMAYLPGTRLNLYSNPSKRAPNGEVMGVANSEENWRVLNSVIDIASAWRIRRDPGQDLLAFSRFHPGLSPASGWQLVAGQFAGDGRTDVAGYHPSDGSIWVGSNTGSSFVFSRFYPSLSPASGWQLVAGQFAGNGLTDVAGYHPSDGSIWVGTNTSSSFVFSRYYPGLSPASGWQLVAGQFAGDGMTDVAGYHPSDGSIWVGTNTGSSFAFSRFYPGLSPASGWKLAAADYTGDGRTDVAGYHPSDGTIWVGANTGSSFAFSLWRSGLSPATGWQFVAGDVTGNALPDLNGYHPSDGSIWAGTNTGSSFDFRRAMAGCLSPAPGWQLVSGEFTGDGFTDVAGYHPSDGSIWVGESNYRPVLSATRMTSPGYATITVNNVSRSRQVWLGYSLSGYGPQPTGYGDLLLSAPVRTFAYLDSSSTGIASASFPVRAGLVGTRIWYQAFDNARHRFSNGLEVRLESGP